DLPGSLGEAIHYAERSELLRRTLGEETFFKYIRNRRMLWETYRARINQYEIEKYLPIL
ncbi:glutamine synthetase, partial [candidate division WOR-3 bacterium]|nr:glutamine synthetase [candidate division WOR-3 bacterium]